MSLKHSDRDPRWVDEILTFYDGLSGLVLILGGIAATLALQGALDSPELSLALTQFSPWAVAAGRTLVQVLAAGTVVNFGVLLVVGIAKNSLAGRLCLHAPYASRKNVANKCKPGISGLVDVMNATGCIETIVACEGHVSDGVAPYVDFRAPIEVALTIERAIRESHRAGHGPVDYWTVVGHFNARYECLFRLSSAMKTSCVGGCGSHWCRLRSLFGVNPCRRVLDRDIQTITHLVAELGLDATDFQDIHRAQKRGTPYQEYFRDSNQGDWEPVPPVLIPLIEKLGTRGDNDDFFNDQLKDVLSILVERPIEPPIDADQITVRASYCPFGRPDNAIQVALSLPLEMNHLSPSEFAATELGRHLIALVKASAVGKFKLSNEKARV